jgi:hypothetical protein
MSPTAPTLVTLNNQLNKAHRRIRELEARETELVAHNTTLCAVIEELTEGHPRAADVTASADDGGDGRPNTGDPFKHPRQRLGGPTPQSPTPVVNPTPAGASTAGADRVKTMRFPFV